MLTEVLRKLREAHNLTQEEVAKYLNVQRTTYTRYETGTNSLNFEALCKLADLYKVTTDYLLERSPMNAVNMNPELLTIYKNADPVYREIAVDILRKGQMNAENRRLCLDACIPLIKEDAGVLSLAELEHCISTKGKQNEAKIGMGDYVVVAKDDSMTEAGVDPGDYIIIHPQGQIGSGEIALVYAKRHMLLRKVFESSKQIVLVPANDAYEAEFIESTEKIHFMGKMLKVIKGTSPVLHG